MLMSWTATMPEHISGDRELSALTERLNELGSRIYYTCRSFTRRVQSKLPLLRHWSA